MLAEIINYVEFEITKLLTSQYKNIVMIDLSALRLLIYFNVLTVNIWGNFKKNVKAKYVKYAFSSKSRKNIIF